MKSWKRTQKRCFIGMLISLVILVLTFPEDEEGLPRNVTTIAQFSQEFAALAEQQHFKAMNGENPVSGSSPSQSSIRVSSEKLDSLVDLIGELVTFNARLEQLAIEKDLPVLKNLSEQSSRLAVSLRDTS